MSFISNALLILASHRHLERGVYPHLVLGTTYYSVVSAIDSSGADSVVAYFATAVVRSRCEMSKARKTLLIIGIAVVGVAGAIWAFLTWATWNIK